ncbi:polysaccharide pyruvyl transferase family protein [Sphingobacterium endophyticum]|uniref:polysaccharide pyruvyl transferase family protein n=1 Tax=Sphingobacterium endophyticum TaxID=2546448 RepID=UPI0012E160EA|nr:polysaccharide pyruvyl transferase family protein [Sphingobacterium endophyticum]
MKKVGLLTMPLIDNYGGIIQIAALYSVIKNLGHEPILIDKKYNLSNSKVLLKKVLSNNPFYKLFDYNNHTQRKRNLGKIDKFISEYFLNKTHEIFNEFDLVNECKNMDTLVVGSDQVWRYKYVNRDLDVYFLSFAKDNQRRISYAASFGVDFWEGNEESKKNVIKLLNKFDAISVREKEGIELLISDFSVDNGIQVLDPTLLPKRSFYDEIIESENHLKKINLFNYVLDLTEPKSKFIENFAKSINLDVDMIHLEEDVKKSNTKPSISEWLYHFKNSEFVITDSFHGTVFSIIYNKQFISIANKNRGVSRFASLLKQLGLEDRLIFEDSIFSINELKDKKIDYDLVNKRLESLREKSIEFLRENV